MVASAIRMPRREEPSTLPQASPNEGAAAPRSRPASNDDEPPPPRLGRYDVLFELARGGMGTVYVGRLVGAHGFDRVVAIKRLSGHRSRDLASFLSEAR